MEGNGPFVPLGVSTEGTAKETCSLLCGGFVVCFLYMETYRVELKALLASSEIVILLRKKLLISPQISGINHWL